MPLTYPLLGRQYRHAINELPTSSVIRWLATGAEDAGRIEKGYEAESEESGSA